MDEATPDISHLVIVHYHLLPGGVTAVIADAVRSMATEISGIRRITLVAGREEGVSSLTEALQTYVRSHGNRTLVVESIVVPLFDYEERVGSVDAASVRDRMTSLAPDHTTMLWIHNYHLGKSPAFTKAVLQIADSADAPPMLLHIHDFPECARFTNLLRLRAAGIARLYPRSRSVRYAVINGRDERYLRQSGVPADQIHLLWNPIVSTHVPLPDHALAARRLRSALRGALSGSQRRILLYPVRSIRRKNVLEAGLIVRLLGNADLLVTLPGVSSSERDYSALVERAMRTNLVPGIFAIGTRLDTLDISFEDLIAGSDAVVSSSVQEGFGYQFINSVLWERPLIARRLDVTEDIMSVLAHHGSAFYDTVSAPFALSVLRDRRDSLRSQYLRHIEQTTTKLGGALTTTTVQNLHAGVDALFDAESLDFSFIPAPVQFEILESLSDPDAFSTLRAANESLLTRIEALLEDPRSGGSQREVVESRFGPRGFAERVRPLLGRRGPGVEPDIPAIPVRGSAGDPVSDALVNRFATLDQFRPLYLPFNEQFL